MKKYFTAYWFITSSLLFTYPTYILADVNIEANKIYEDASRLMEGIKEKANNYSQAIQLYEHLDNEIKRLFSQYPSSSAAIDLKSGKNKIAGLNLEEFRKLKLRLANLAKAEKELLPSSLLVAKTIKKIDKKAIALVTIAEEYAQAGKETVANQILLEALEVAQAVEEQILKSIALTRITQAYAKIGQFDQALKIIEIIQSATWKIPAMMHVVNQYIATGQHLAATQILSQALEISAQVKKELDTAEVLAYIARKNYAVGEKKKALQILSKALKIAEQYKAITWSRKLWQNMTFSEIAISYAAMEEIDKAMEIVKVIEQTLHREKASLVRLYIINKYAENNQFDRVSKILAKNRSIVSEWNILARTHIAKQYILRGQQEKAIQMLSQALEMNKNIENIDNQAKAFVFIANQYAKTNQPTIANQILSKALKATELIEEIDAQVVVLFDIALAYINIGRFEQALKIIEKIDKIYLKSTKVLRDADHLIQTRKGFEYIPNVVDAIKITEASDDLNYKVKVLLAIAEKYYENKQPEMVARTLSRSLEAAETIEKAYPKTLALAQIARKYIETQQQINQTDLMPLRKIVQSAQPISQFWAKY